MTEVAVPANSIRGRSPVVERRERTRNRSLLVDLIRAAAFASVPAGHMLYFSREAVGPRRPESDAWYQLLESYPSTDFTYSRIGLG